MVCPRCIDTVRNVLIKENIPYNTIVLGKVDLAKPISADDRNQLIQQLENHGFELIDNKENQLVNAVKSFIIEKIYYQKHKDERKISEALSQSLEREYSSISKQFSKSQGVTIEQFYTLQKIERVKELLSYGEKSLSEIANELEYSSSAYLSSQFKRVTGMTPSAYKSLLDKPRKGIDSV